MTTKASDRTQSAFTLVEIVIAIALVSTLMIAFIGLLANSIQSAQDAAKRTILGQVFADLHHRIEGNLLEPGTLKSPDGFKTSPFFYSPDGVYVGTKGDNERSEQERYYRVDVELVETKDKRVSEHSKGLLAAMIDISWPVDPRTGESLGNSTRYHESLTYYVNTMAGPGWQTVDPSYKPIIEY